MREPDGMQGAPDQYAAEELGLGAGLVGLSRVTPTRLSLPLGCMRAGWVVGGLGWATAFTGLLMRWGCNHQHEGDGMSQTPHMGIKSGVTSGKVSWGNPPNWTAGPKTITTGYVV